MIIRICDKCENQFDSNSNQIFRKQLSYVFLSLSFSICVRLFTLFVCLFVYLSLEKTLEICLNEIGFLKWFFLYRIFLTSAMVTVQCFFELSNFNWKTKTLNSIILPIFENVLVKFCCLSDPTDLWYNRLLEVDYHFHLISFNFWIKKNQVV